jgi:hypothetical protein
MSTIITGRHKNCCVMQTSIFVPCRSGCEGPQADQQWPDTQHCGSLYTKNAEHPTGRATARVPLDRSVGILINGLGFNVTMCSQQPFYIT